MQPLHSTKAPLIMGVLNVTPDSFSDGGKHFTVEHAIAHAKRMIDEGADVIDIGGESTRPGALKVSISEESKRVLPVVEAVAKLPTRVSIDTRNSEVAEAALKRGALIVNDVSGGADPKMKEVVASHKAIVILMHLRGSPETMQKNTHYPGGIEKEVMDFLFERVRLFQAAGVEANKIWVDPGIGFGKSVEGTLALLRAVKSFASLADRLVIGTSRKSFLSSLVGPKPLEIEDREPGTLASNLWAYSQGASVFRVHDVGGFHRALATWRKISGDAEEGKK